jgi:hypothetical protein
MATAELKPVVYILLRYTSAELFFSCCDSVAARLKHAATSLPLQGFWRSTPRFYAAGAGGVITVETCVGAAAKLRQATEKNYCPAFE